MVTTGEVQVPTKSQVERVKAAPKRLTYRRQRNENGRFVGAYLGGTYFGCYYEVDISTELGWNTIGLLYDDKEGTAKDEADARSLLEKELTKFLQKTNLSFSGREKKTPPLVSWILPYWAYETKRKRK